MKAPLPLLLATTTLALAQPAPGLAAAPSDSHRGEGAQSPHGDPHQDADPAEIVVAGHPPIDFTLMSASTSLEGDSLVGQTRAQIGDTLAALPGVSATSFAPGASRPVLRGFDGDRVAVLTDGIGAIDASNVSADHAVVLDPLTIDHIDVLHGPAVLLFGGQAIGGAVNALDKRIPRKVPDGIAGTLLGGYGSSARERSLGGAVDLRLADRLVAHVDASWRKSGDMRVGGLVNSPELRADLLDDAAAARGNGDTDAADQLEALAAQSGRIVNSGARTTNLGAGLAFIDAGGNLGISVQRFDSRYGVPLRPGPGEAEEVAIDLVQTRVDLRGAIELGGLFDNLQVRGAFGDYAHTELEDGEAGTHFAGKGVEFRADLVQANRNGWRGRSGISHFSRKMTIAGAEAFVPDNAVERTGLFTLQSVELGSGFGIEAAGRIERASVSARQIGFARHFTLLSGAAGLSWEFAEGWKAGVNYTHGARAPSPEELLSDGAHVATQSYELGDPGFGKETSNGVEATLSWRSARGELALTAYSTRFANFIAARPTGELRDDLPVFRYMQLPARYRGFEASGSWQALDWGTGSLRLDAAADYLRARLKNAGPAPRIPPLRLRGGAEWQQGDLHLRGEVEWNDAQNRVAAHENPVRGFTLVNLSADWHPMGEEGPLTLLFSADNLLDVVGRRAASFTRDFVPLSGRDLRVTAKLTF